MEVISEFIVFVVGSPVIAVAIVLELTLSNISNRGNYSFRGVAENCYLTLLNMGVDVAFRSISFIVLSWTYQYRVIDPLSGIVYWLCLLLCEDFVYYWLHRLDHHCRLFWAIHVTHHSAEEFNLTVGFRSSVFQPLYRFVFFIPLTLIGFGPTDIFLMYSATQLYGILLHTEYNVRLGILEYVLVSPSHHRVHHGSNPEYLDKNLGMVFIFWDRWFGTFKELTTPVTYGITKPIQQRDAFNLVFHEWRDLVKDFTQECTFADKVKYIFGKPGWRHKS